VLNFRHFSPLQSPMFPIPHVRLIGATLAALFAGVRILLAQDAPAVNEKQILQQLQQLKEQQVAGEKSTKLKAYQEALSAASNPAKAIELWQESVRLTKFQGAGQESAQFREYKAKEAEAFKATETLTALHLYFNWLAITLQRSTGISVHDLLPAIIGQAREARNAEMMIDALEINLKKEREAMEPVATNYPVGPRRAPVPALAREKRDSSENVRRLYDEIANRPLGGSVYVEAMHLTEYLTNLSPSERAARQAAKNDTELATDWEPTPANADGIYEKVVLPQLRTEKDARAVEYWDGKMQREADRATLSKLTFEIEKFNQVRRSQLLWNRAEEYAQIGQKNRAITEMFAVIKGNPTHADAGAWIAELKTLLVPAPPAGAAAPASSAAAISAAAPAGK